MSTLPRKLYTVVCREGYKLVEVIDSPQKKPRFLMMSHHLMPHLAEMDASATWLLWTLAAKRDVSTNIAVLPKSSLSEAQYGRVRKGLPTLEQKGICKRIKQNTYMFNPDFLIPICGYAQVRHSYESHPARR